MAGERRNIEAPMMNPFHAASPARGSIVSSTVMRAATALSAPGRTAEGDQRRKEPGFLDPIQNAAFELNRRILCGSILDDVKRLHDERDAVVVRNRPGREFLRRAGRRRELDPTGAAGQEDRCGDARECGAKQTVRHRGTFPQK
jgi:hypothetical protein